MNFRKGDKLVRKEVTHQKIYKLRKNRKGTQIISKEPVGYLVAVVCQVGHAFMLAPAYSLCHKNDCFDYVPTTNRREKKFGLEIAQKRAFRWAQRKEVQIPPSIEANFRGFLKRCKRQFNIPIVAWARSYE